MKQEKQKQVCARKTSIGGQALMEGIMMRGPRKSAMAVRNPQGSIVVEEFETKGAQRPAICRWPVIRGIFGYIDSMAVGYRCLMRSAEIAGLEDVVEESPRKKKKREAREAAAAAAAGAAPSVPSGETGAGAPQAASTAENTQSTGAAGNAQPAGTAENTQPAGAAENAQPSGAAEENVTSGAAESAQQDGAGTAAGGASAAARAAAAAEGEKKLPAWVMTAMMIGSGVLAVALAVGLFIILPSLLFDLLAMAFPYLKDTGSAALNSLFKSGFEGIVKVLLLVGYMAAISLMKDIRRTFMFHGAEHKTIFCYEAGLELTVENVRRQRRFHPRCGTSFLILMVLVSIFISFFIDPVTILISGHTLPTVWRYLVRLLLIPLVVGLGYELIKYAGRHSNLLTHIVSAPGMWLQHLTVFEPTDDMIECAIAAVTPVIPEDGSDRW